jgi:hypothetical protein
LRELKERHLALEEALDQLAATLAAVPDEETIRCYVERTTCPLDGKPVVFVHDDAENLHLGGNDLASWLQLGARHSW